MKKRELLATLTVMAAFGMSACGTKELELTANRVEAELGSELDTEVTSYVADADVAAEAVIDFSAVDMTKTGTYNATVTYKDQTAGLEVVIVDTTAPEVTVADKVVVAAGEPLYAKDVITSITELSGEAEVAFSEPEVSADDASADAGEESVEETEAVENTGMAEPTEEVESTEAADATAEETESAVDSVASTEETEFVLSDVICSNAYVIYPETGEYDNTLTVTDASGNSTDVTVHIVVGDAPEFSGIEGMTVPVGTEAGDIDFLDGVTAKDSSGNDITANIVCDSTAVDLTTAGKYEITYTVTDGNGFTATQTATVTVEEKSGKKSDSKKSDSGKTDSKTDSAKKNDSASSSSSSNSSNNSSAASNGASSGNDVSGGNSNNASGDSGNSGNSSNGNNNSGNSNQASGGNNASSDTGNTSTPSADNSSNTSTPSTDNSGSTSTPSTPAPAPETPSTPSADSGNTGNSSSGGMTVPDGIVIEDYDTSENEGTGGTSGGGVTDVGTN